MRCSECRYVVKRWHAWHSEWWGVVCLSPVQVLEKWVNHVSNGRASDPHCFFFLVLRRTLLNISLKRVIKRCFSPSTLMISGRVFLFTCSTNVTSRLSWVFFVGQIPILAVDCNANVRHKQDRGPNDESSPNRKDVTVRHTKTVLRDLS